MSKSAGRKTYIIEKNDGTLGSLFEADSRKDMQYFTNILLAGQKIDRNIIISKNKKKNFYNLFDI